MNQLLAAAWPRGSAVEMPVALVPPHLTGTKDIHLQPYQAWLPRPCPGEGHCSQTGACDWADTRSSRSPELSSVACPCLDHPPGTTTL